MCSALRHRGPDDDGIESFGPASLGMRRLAIFDPAHGHQPMHTPDGRFHLIFNGSIFNFKELRAELSTQGRAFQTDCDTEVLLAALAEYGEAALRKLRGMFAFALWDSQEQTLFFGRDPFGIKPFYFAPPSRATNDLFVFASELRALIASGCVSAEIDPAAVSDSLAYLAVPAPRTFYRAARCLRPGECGRWRNGRVELHSYWEFPGGPLHRVCQSREEFIRELRAKLEDAVRAHLVADVPVGAFLSGGIDSSLVVALMQKASARPVRTFTIGFEEEAFNEAPFARRVAEHLQTEHTELIVTPREAMAIIPKLPSMYDEPFADSSQIPTSLVCSLARQDVTVALSGDGGDELFGGYSRYLEARDRWRGLQVAPAPLRSSAAHALERTPDWALDAVTAPLRVMARLRGRRQVADRIQERAYIWGARSLPELYEAMTSYWQPSDRFVIGASRSQTYVDGVGGQSSGLDPLAHMMYADTCRYLPDDILVKVDRAAMAVSLETRVPLLDAGVAQAAWRIPSAVHMRDGKGKWVLRELLHRYVPRELFVRPKQGFSVPVGGWMRKELKDWAAALLDPARMRREGYFEVPLIERRWQQHLRGEMNWQPHLWGVLMFQAWLEEFDAQPAARTWTPPPAHVRSDAQRSVERS